MTRPVAVWGVGTSDFGKQSQLGVPELSWPAVVEALGDAGVTEVDACTPVPSSATPV